ncbi:MAG: hypothetical protein D3M94_18735 [Rhodocyclales bacterium GT-UBC]|nr:MAG: hypothetical protein D3M94_18735 [Rhodocyclales bacterium GT-UBC]
MNPILSIYSKWRLVVMALFSSCISLAGCTTFLASEMESRDPNFHSQPSASDQLVAIGKLDKNAEKELDIPGGLVLIGHKQSYLITKGGGELEAIAKASFGPDVEILERYHDSNSHLYLDKRKFWGKVALRINRDQDYSPEQQLELANMGFDKKETASSRKNRNVYTKSIDLEGVTIAPIKVPDSLAQHLSHSRSIAFYPPENQEAPPNLEKYLALPLAMVVDVVTAPIQILGFGAILLIWEAQGGHLRLF